MKYITVDQLLKEIRHERSYTQSFVSEHTGIDNGLLSKYESGRRELSEEHVRILESFYELGKGKLFALWVSAKVEQLISPYAHYPGVSEAAEERVKYLRRTGHLSEPSISIALQKKLQDIDEFHRQWKLCKPLDSLQLKKLKEYFHIRYTYDSNRIEGNTLSLQETHLIIQEGITVSGKSMLEHLEAINHADAIHFLEMIITKKEPFNQRVLLELHQLILKGVDNKHAGVFRTVPVMISGSKHRPPEPYMVDKLMEEYFEFYRTYKDSLHPVILAAEMHERLVTIHPFIDGNGRVSRLVMNFILLSHGYTLLILKGDLDARLAYYSALENVQVNGIPGPFHTLIMDHAMESLQEHLASV